MAAKKRLPFGGMMIKPDAKLGAIIGSKPVPPSGMTKKIWIYIKSHKLLKR
jgi:chromatin remodeling complex protein RSC6